MTIELNNEMVREIVVESLEDILKSFADDIEKVVETKESANFSSDDVAEELSELMKNYNALKQVLSLYTV